MKDWSYRARPEVGRRVQHYHPHLGELAFGTVDRIEERGGLFRVYLVDCTYDGEPAPDTYFDELAETWRYVYG